MARPTIFILAIIISCYYTVVFAEDHETGGAKLGPNAQPFEVTQFDLEKASYNSSGGESYVSSYHGALEAMLYPHENKTVYELRYDIEELYKSKPLKDDLVLSTDFSIADWKKIKYLAYGWMDTGGVYHHVKSFHPVQGESIKEKVGTCGYDMHINNIKTSADSNSIRSIRIFIKGQPKNTGGKIRLEKIGITSCKNQYFFNLGKNDLTLATFKEWFWSSRKELLASVNKQAYNFLLNYYDEINSNYTGNASTYIEEGKLAMRNVPTLSWRWDELNPTEIGQYTTTRYLYHSLNQVSMLLMAYSSTQEQKYLLPVQGLIGNWLDNNLLLAGDDQKYIWYDHGVAMRLMTLCHAWVVGLQAEFDTRFMEKLAHLIIDHSELLASEQFYVRNQTVRYHNHAVFQDMALMVSSLLMSSVNQTGRWMNIAKRRIKDQFEHLVTDEGVSVENSSGYHFGLMSLCSTVDDLMKSSSTESGISDICSSMSDFSAAIRYMDHRYPSFGDSFRETNIKMTKPFQRENDDYGVLPFVDSGYVVVRGGLTTPWQFLFMAPSRSITHKHEDNLNLIFWANGVEWLIDPGFFSHHYDESIPAYARSARAHNVPFVPGRKYSIAPMSASLDTPSIIDDNFTIKGESGSIEGIVVNRKVRGDIKGNTINVVDSIHGILKNGEKVVFPLHLGEGVNASLTATGAVLSSFFSGTQVRLDWGNPMDCRIEKGKDIVAGGYGWSFPSFGVTIPIETIVCALPGNTSAWNISVINDGATQEESLLGK